MSEPHDLAIRRYRIWYAALLRLYSKPFRHQFAESMEQTFGDLLHERAREQQPLGTYTLQLFSETVVGIMKDRTQSLLERNKDLTGVFIGTFCILMIPLISMQFSEEVNWGPGDFLVAATLLIGIGTTYKLIARKRIGAIYKIALGLGLFSGLFLIWANLAVGLIGNEENPANLMYLGVIATLGIGAFISKFKPLGMSRTLFAAATAQITVTLIAFFLGYHQLPGHSLTELININSLFIILFTLSGLLFLQAHRTNSQPISPS